MDNTKHTANFLASSFLNSKRSLKKIYNLNPVAIAALRYICDSIDINYKKRKSFQSKIYQSQIAKYIHIDRRNIGPHLKLLIKKKFIQWDPKTHIFTLGKVLIACGVSSLGIDLRRNVTYVRHGTKHDISNSSNFTNYTANKKNENIKVNCTLETQSTSANNIKEKRAESVGKLLEDYQKKNNLSIKN